MIAPNLREILSIVMDFQGIAQLVELGGEWLDVSSRLLQSKESEPNGQAAQTILDEVRKFVTYCAGFFALTSDDE